MDRFLLTTVMSMVPGLYQVECAGTELTSDPKNWSIAPERDQRARG